MILKHFSTPRPLLLAGSLLLIFTFGACSLADRPEFRPVIPDPTRVIPPSAVAPSETPRPTDPSADPTPAPEIPPPLEVTVEQSTDWKIYKNNAAGLGFMFPPDWYGPEVYEWDGGVRLEVGSDIVYPYGTSREEQIYSRKNSYYIVIQYSKNTLGWTMEQYQANQPWTNLYLSLLDLQDGESISGRRGLDIRVRELKLGRFTGLELISTLSETAQTEFFYVRQVISFDDRLNNLQITGSPNNLEIVGRDNWREAYQEVDEAHLDTFHKVLNSITME